MIQTGMLETIASLLRPLYGLVKMERNGVLCRRHMLVGLVFTGTSNAGLTRESGSVIHALAAGWFVASFLLNYVVSVFCERSE